MGNKINLKENVDEYEKKENQNDSKNYSFIEKNALSIPILISCVLTLCNVVVIVYEFLSHKDISIGDLLTTDVVTLIGIAISVWIGITISNSVENTRIKNIENSLNLANQTRSNLEEKNKQLTEQIENLQDLQLEINKQLLITEVSKNYDLLAEYLLFKIKTNSSKDYFLLYSIEKEFSDIQSIHNSYQLSSSQKMTKYDAILEKVKNAKLVYTNSEKNEIILDYLSCKEANCYFYKGYICEAMGNVEKQFYSFQIAKELYTNVLKRNSLLDLGTGNNIHRENPRLQVHVFNVLGECNSKQMAAYNHGKTLDIAKEEIKKIENAANSYCSKVVKLMNTYNEINDIEKKEIYYRNYGWTIMNSSACDEENNIDKLNEAKKQFIAAYKINKEKYKVYISLLSVNIRMLSKLINHQIYLSLKYLDKLETITLTDNENENIINQCKILHKENIEWYKITKTKFPEQGETYLYEIWELLLLKITNFQFDDNNFDFDKITKIINYNLDYVSKYTNFNTDFFNTVNDFKSFCFGA